MPPDHASNERHIYQNTSDSSMTMPPSPPPSPNMSSLSRSRPLVRAYSLSSSGSIMRVHTLADSLHASYGRPFQSEHLGPGARRKCHSDGDMGSSNRSIKFDKVEIREYNRQVGDNPSCSGGPPMGLSWEYNPETAALPLEHYESTRGPRRTSKQMAMPRSVREEMLRKEWGVKQSDIAQAVRENLRIKNSRRRTVMNLTSPMTKVEEKMEGVKKGLKRSLRLRKSFRDQYDEWKNQAEEAAALAERLDAEAMIAEENAAAQAEAEAEQQVQRAAATASIAQESGMSAADVSAGLKRTHPVVVINEEDEENPADDDEPFEGALKDWSFLAADDDNNGDVKKPSALSSTMPIKNLDSSQSSGAPTSETYTVFRPAPVPQKSITSKSA